jgi:hypothetical protein
MIEIRFDKTKNEVALLIWFLVDHSVQNALEYINQRIISVQKCCCLKGLFVFV